MSQKLEKCINSEDLSYASYDSFFTFKFGEDPVVSVGGCTNIRTQAVKREKSLSDSLEREKKRVKFNPNVESSLRHQGRRLVDKYGVCADAKVKEKGILKNKEAVRPTDTKISTESPDLYQENKENELNYLNPIDEVFSARKINGPGAIMRQNTFTKPDSPDDTLQPTKIHSQGNKTKMDDKYPISKSKNCKCDVQTKSNFRSDEKNGTGKGDTTKISHPLWRKRTLIEPKESKCNPETVPLIDRNVTPNKKRLPQRDKQRTLCPADSSSREPARKYLVIGRENTVKFCRKEALSAEFRSFDSKDLQKTKEENESLKQKNKILEEKLKGQINREKELATQQRAQKEQHEIQTLKLVRESKREAAVLLSELKSKDRLVTNLRKELREKAGTNLRKRSASVDDEATREIHRTPRPCLIRSASAAASIGRRLSPQTPKGNKPVKKNEPSRTSVAQQRAEISGKGSNTERRFVSTLEQMRRRIEAQQKEIKALQDRLRTQSPNLEHLSHLGASVQAISEADQSDRSQNPNLKLTPDTQDARHDLSTPKTSALTTIPANVECQIRNKDCEISNGTMSSHDEIRYKSLDLYGSKFSSMEAPSSLHYSSLVSLNGNRREAELSEENEMLRAELQETRDHAELLEFRILEFTEGIQRATGIVHSTCDQSTNTSADDVITPPPISEDLSLPLSVDSGLELNVDNHKTSRLSEYRRSLSRLEEAAGFSESSSVANLASLLDWVSSSIGSGSHDNVPHTMSPRSPVQKKLGVHGITPGVMEETRFQDISENDLAMLATKLQESLSNPKAQEEVLEETIAKLRSLSGGLSRLQSRVSALTLENKELQEALTTLHDSHETRTEASGTESELVHGKTPSLHSDLSDSESDDSSRPAKRPNLETTTSFQESGIFESSCEMINAATQTPQTFETTKLISEAQNEQTSAFQDLKDCNEVHEDTEEDENEITAEVDLQTALARLTSIKNVVLGKNLGNLRWQDLQESDEYLVAALEGEKVTLCKIEYDTIVATERSLQREIEILQYEKEQLAIQCASLEQKLREPVKDDVCEVLKAQVRLLEEKFEISERQRRQYFDEKCEIEEAENDARLLSQRLESQLEAAREMESLLSASLSQEQEFCRELQRRVREMHQIDKGRRLHEEVLEKESQFCREREAALMIANDSQKSQLTFALYGLILAQFWRRLAARNKAAVVPYSSLEDAQFMVDALQLTNEGSLLPSFPCFSECQRCLSEDFGTPINCVSVADANTQTLPENYAAEVGLVDDLDSEAVIKSQTALERMAKSVVGLSEREEFYISQIEALQKERKSLREDYENEQALLILQLQNMKGDLETLQQSLEESQRDKCKLLFKLEEAQAVIASSELELQNQAKNLKIGFNKSVEVYQQEQKAMQDQYEERLAEMRRGIDLHEQRFSALLQQYSILQHELEPYFHQVSDAVDEYGSEESSSGRILTTKDLLCAVRELVRSESSTKQKLAELEKKESAYRETINEADRIMSNHVTIYAQKIEELEAVIEQKTSRIKQLETSEERLRSTMKSSWKSGEGARITELLDRLIETENSELSLKERVWNLERNGKELQIKFAEAEKAQENLRSELRDQEELVQRLMALKSENNALTSKLQDAHEAARRASDIQQSENYLKARVDELETSESGLRETLKKTEQLMMQRDRKFRDQMSNLEEENRAVRSQLELRSLEAKQSKDVETSLRHQIENLKGHILNLEKELKDSSSENLCHETQHRSEVQKLRTQLKLANAQLTDLDILNGELKDQLKTAESTMKEVAIQLEERTRRHEKDVLSLNLQMNQKDSKLEEFEAQLQQFAHAKLVREFDFLATSPFVNIKNSLDEFIKNSKTCDECNRSQNPHVKALSDCLKTLNEVINGRNSHFESESEDSEANQGENVANESQFKSTPSALTNGGFTDSQSSGEGETSSIYSLTLTNDSLPDVGTPPPHNLPSAPPRPRRDAKKKKKLRKTLKTEGSLLEELEESPSAGKGLFFGSCLPSVTILEELEEKVRELEEVVARKDEELRLADGEASELHSRLIEEDGKLIEKTMEAQQTSEALESLRQQLINTAQEYEAVRQELESKHKVDMSAMTKKIETLTEDVLRISEKSNVKDKIIATLVKQIRAILRSGSPVILINEIRKISECKKSKTKEANLKIVDFDLDSVCTMLEAPPEVFADFDCSFDALSFQSLPSFASLESEMAIKKSWSSSDSDKALKSRVSSSITLPQRSSSQGTTRSTNLPPIEQKQSRIPRYRSLSTSPLRKITPKTLSANQDNNLKVAGSILKRLEPKTDLRSLVEIVPKQRPMATVAPKPKAVVESRSKFLTDARKIKRMVTGLAPLTASVDCALAPEFKKQPNPPLPSCVPRPLDLRITRRVGIDGAVIAWNPLEHDCVAGFQVIVDGRVVQQVRSPHRTKALVTGLPFPSSFTIALVTVAEDGRCSSPALVSYEKCNTYKQKAQQKNSPVNATPKRAVPTCL